LLSIRALAPADAARVMALNSSAQPHVALLDRFELARLLALSDAHLAVVDGPNVVGYALVFQGNSAYDGEEFLAFRSQLSRPFTYIDQVVVFESVRGAGAGRLLYDAIGRSSIARGALYLCCEVNAAPPNPASLAFHRHLGFEASGSLATRDGRRVDMLLKPLSVED
jgi:predicted GNAT superfamily acetyltransferase